MKNTPHDDPSPDDGTSHDDPKMINLRVNKEEGKHRVRLEAKKANILLTSIRELWKILLFAPVEASNFEVHENTSTINLF